MENYTYFFYSDGLLRCLHLAETDKEGWQTFQSFLSHEKERERSNKELQEYHAEHSVQFVREICERGGDYTEQELHRMIGIMSTNALDISLGIVMSVMERYKLLTLMPGKGYGELMGFYPLFSNLNHSCLANAKAVKRRDKCVEVRAKRGIRAGEEICIQYLLETQPTRVRRELIARKWFFQCSCLRCSDRTEAGTFLDGLKCRAVGCGGTVLPVSPLESLSDFSCHLCEAKTSASEVTAIVQGAEAEACRRVGREVAIDHMESVIEKYRDILHETNYIVLSLKMKLACLYGNLPPSSVLAKMSPRELQRKSDYCRQGLHVIYTLDEGNVGENTWKVRLEKELKRTNFILFQLTGKE